MTLLVVFRPKVRDVIVAHPSKPLDNFPLIRSRDVEEVRSCIARVYARPVLIPGRCVEGFNATINACQLHDVGLLYGSFGAALGFEFPPIGLFCQLFPVRGRGETACGKASSPLSAGASAVISSDAPHNTNISADYEHLVLRIRARALTEKLAAMTGAAINEPLRMEPEQNFKHPAAQMLQQYIPVLAETLSDAAPPFPPWWIAQTEQLLMTLFLCGHRHNYSHLLEEDPPDVALSQVRRAEEYIAANAQRAITLEELAGVTGLSGFSLFRTFRKCRGYSPFEFLSRVRSKQDGASS